MSLFSSRQWWQTRLGSGEEFDQGSICVANIDNDPVGTVKIITGSIQGVLRVHQPHQQGYHIEDILLEAQLDSSILQLAAGNFLGGTNLCLAVLHPRKLSVYALQAVGSSYLQLSKLYEHALEHTAANLAYGPFGSVTGVDYIVVQSYDGQLTFFEQEVQSFSRLLPGFLLPGPLAYMAASDSFITATAGLELVSYRYNSIAAANWDPKQQQGGNGGKQIQEDWKVVLGETALDIQCGNVSTAADGTAPSILVLAEHTFFILDLYGHILVQRQLDNHPSCFWSYPANPTASSTDAAAAKGGSVNSRGPAAAVQTENLLIATHTKALQVYRGQQLAWAAQLELVPVAVRVTSIAGVRGMIVALDDSGTLSVLFLGTEPPKQSITFTESRPLDYAAMEQERVALLAKLKAAGGAAGLDAAAAAKAEAQAGSSQAPLLLKAKVPNRLDSADMGGFGGGGVQQGSQQQRQLTVTLLLSNTTKSALQDVSISVLAPAPAAVVESQLYIPQLTAASRGSAAAEVQLVFQVPGSSSSDGPPAVLPATNMAEVVVTFKGPDGERGVSTSKIQLPMCLFCQVVPPIKASDFKLTVSTNREAVQVMELFSDMVAQANPAHAEGLSRSQTANVLSFRFPGGQDVSILVSKNGGRYRLQSSCLEAMWLVLQELHSRLVAYIAAADKKPGRAAAAAAAAGDGVSEGGGEVPAGPFKMTLDDALPLQDVFDLIEHHFSARQAISSIDSQLEQQGVMFRSIQKRLLVRYKDKNAAPLNQLDVLMEEAYEHIMELTDKLAAAQGQLLVAGQALGSGVQLLLLLCKLRFELAPAELQLLSCCLSPAIHQGPEVGWEETTEAAMTQLLRTSLARSQKDAAAVVPPLAPAQDTARLQKHLSLVLERLSKGMRLSSN